MEVTRPDVAFASLFEGNPDAIVMYDRDGAFVRANAAARELMGYDADEMAGTTFQQVVNPKDVGAVASAFRGALNGFSEHFNTTVRRKDARIVPIECHVFPVRDGGQISGVYAQARDVVALAAAEDSLTLNQERFRSLFEYHPDGIMALKTDGCISRVNVALEADTGFYGEQLIGESWTQLIAPEDREAADGAFRRAQRGEASEFDAHLLDRLGNRLEMQMKLVPLRVAQSVEGAYAIAKNVEAQRSAERAIESQHARIRELYLVAASRGDSIDKQIDRVLELGCRLFGFDYGYVARVREDVVEILNGVGGDSPVTRGNVYPRDASFSRHVQGDRQTLFIPNLDEEPWRADPARRSAPWRSYFGTKLRVNDEDYGTLVFTSKLPRDTGLEDSDRDLIQLMGLFVAAAFERLRHAERIEQLAFYDALTGLPNRVLFGDRIRQTMAAARRYERGFAVMYVDLDNFKDVNDKYGHGAGDKVLETVADRLLVVLRESDTVARFGGDEFVILQPVVNGPADAADLARKVVEAMLPEIEIDAHSVSVKASVGIAMYPEDGTTIEELMDRADRALYRAKAAGRNRWLFYDDETVRKQLAALSRRTAPAESAE